MDEEAGSRPRFTERQRKIVTLIAAGLSNAEIAQRLAISPRTVQAHTDNLRFKLQVERRRQIPSQFRLFTGEDPLRIAAETDRTETS